MFVVIPDNHFCVVDYLERQGNQRSLRKLALKKIKKPLWLQIVGNAPEKGDGIVSGQLG